MADCLDAIKAQGVAINRVLLIGGGARAEAVRRIAPAVWGYDVEVPEPGEYVAEGAARQAAWVLTGGEQPPVWEKVVAPQVYKSSPTPEIHATYSVVRDSH